MEMTKEHLKQAAALLEVDVPTIMAVDTVESSGKGFLKSKKIKIKFEGHKFYVYAKKRDSLSKKYPTLCYPDFTQRFSPPNSEDEYRRFSQAFALDPEAAMMATSWGKFQMMGFNYKIVGFETVGDMVDYLKKGEAEQLEVFCRFLLAEGLHEYLQAEDYASFARAYNGPAYKTNKYDTKIKMYVTKYRRTYVP